MPIISWSHSRLGVFESCARRAFLQFEAKIPEPERPLPLGKTEHANDRGTRIHEGCEGFVRYAKPLPTEAGKYFRAEFDALKNLYEQGRVSLEGEWGMNQAWEPCGWNGDWVEIDDVKTIKSRKYPPVRPAPSELWRTKQRTFIWTPAWLRLKLDAIVHVSAHEAIAIDFKSGRKFGNELKHAEQLQLYQLVAFLRYPMLETITTELWYLDQDELTSATFTRAQGLRFQRNWDMRGNKVTSAIDFPPNSNHFSCRYCAYGLPEHGFENGTGHCTAGRK